MEITAIRAKFAKPVMLPDSISSERLSKVGKALWTLFAHQSSESSQSVWPLLAVGSVIVYAAIVEFTQDAFSEYIGLRVDRLSSRPECSGRLSAIPPASGGAASIWPPPQPREPYFVRWPFRRTSTPRLLSWLRGWT